MTSAVITPETKETTPSLTVTISKLSSSSPFPSPGSPFLPPPVPSAHEYALIAPLSKRRSTDSRMNVGSKADHETVPSTHPVGVTNTAATAGKSSSSVTKSQPAPDPDKRRESADIITNGSNGLAASPYALEPSKPDSEATVNGQTTPTVPLLDSAGAEAPNASQPSHEGTFNTSSSTRSTPDDDAGGTSLSPSTPPLNSHNSPAPDRWCPTTANPSLSRISTTTTTTTEDAPKSSLGNPKSPSCTSLRASRDLSLTSSRPAPPSPADSRRASGALSLSRHSSTRSRPGSLSSLTPANTHDPEAASPTTPTPIQQQHHHHQHHQHHQQQQQNAEQRASTSSAVASPQKLVKIRDFAFPDEDVRHTCTGPLTPRPNRRLQRPLSTWSASSASSTGSEDRDDGTGAGLGASSFGFSGWGLGRLGWFGGRGSVGSTGAGADAGDGPSQGDFARNFTELTSPDYEIEDPYDSLDDEDEDDVDEDNATAGRVGVEGHEERPLLPGLYRALYAFEPEGTAEMALDEDQVVRVIGRGGGVGWAIVARDGDDGHALVPEGYLELVSLDRDQVGEEEG